MAGNDAGYIYAIAAEGTPYVKIGLSAQHPSKRLQLLQIGSPDVLTLIGAVEVAEALTHVERSLHTTLAPSHHRGEWFALVLDAPTLATMVRQAQDSVSHDSEPQGEGQSVRITVLVEQEMLTALDLVMQEMRGAMPGVRIDRSTAVRYLLSQALAPYVRTTEAPVTLGEARSADPEAQSVPKAAPERTTVRTGRKLPAAKG